MMEQPRTHALMVAQVCRGRFTSRFHAENELNRLERLARKQGNSIIDVAKIVYIPQTYQEAQEAAFHERLP